MYPNPVNKGVIITLIIFGMCILLLGWIVKRQNGKKVTAARDKRTRKIAREEIKKREIEAIMEEERLYAQEMENQIDYGNSGQSTVDATSINKLQNLVQ